MMMFPETTASPPYIFTPRRFDSESRPLRGLPPAFLCAMTYFLNGSGSAGDRGDLDFWEMLTVAGAAAIVLAAAQLEGEHLVGTAVGLHLAGDLAAGDEGGAQDRLLAVLAQHQHLVEGHVA